MNVDPMKLKDTLHKPIRNPNPKAPAWVGVALAWVCYIIAFVAFVCAIALLFGGQPGIH
jgi:hypothetical protein